MGQRLHHFHGGLHLPDHKAMSTGKPLEWAPLPKRLTLPLQQHIGAAAKPVVEAGDKVLKGQMLAQASGHVSAPIHAPTSGTVIAIEEHAIPHPSGLKAACIVLESDGEDNWYVHESHPEYEHLEPQQLRSLIRDAGIVGLGGAGFPAHIKLNPGARTAVDTLVLNGAECEPYITCDDALMRERPDGIVAGARIMRHALQARKCIIAIEDNKPEAISAMRDALERIGEPQLQVIAVPTRYPTGGEKQLIQVLTGKEVPLKGLPIDIGIVCHNVATAASVFRAVVKGEPLISRIITVTGENIHEPKNLEVLFGTPIQEVIEAAGGISDNSGSLLMGGPMMGFALHDLQLPVIKTTNCLLAKQPEPARGPTLACIRCGECARVCPASLLPQQLYWYARSKEFDKIQDQNLFACIECGCCDYVCPSNIPLVHYYRYAKTEIWEQERERHAADLARQRHEFQTERKEREKAERAARMKKKKQALADKKKPGKGGADADAKKEAIKAAMERAKAKRVSGEVKPKNVDNLSAEQQRKIDEVDARRAANRDAHESSEEQS